MGSTKTSPHLDVAIVGGGITGLTLALGLQARNVKYTIYERAPSLKEIGAGVGFSPNAERAMELLNPDVHAAFKAVANANGEDYFQWVDGYDTGELIYKLCVGDGKFQGCRRSDFVEGLARKIPSETVRFRKELTEIRTGDDGRPIVGFKDGEEIAADIGSSHSFSPPPFHHPLTQSTSNRRRRHPLHRTTTTPRPSQPRLPPILHPPLLFPRPHPHPPRLWRHHPRRRRRTLLHLHPLHVQRS
jgi:hypothetical protein